jgi:glycosyltransferase involved in cell wall biosynthesis
VRDVGGTVLLHDARMTGLYSEVQKARPDRLVFGSVGFTVGTRYPDRYRKAIELQWIIPPDLAAQSGVHLLAEIVAAADQVLVHSEYAATLTELDTGVRPHVAFPIPCVEPVGVGEPIDPGNHRLVSVGIVSPTKCPDVLIDAMASVRRRCPDATLTFVGDGPADHVADLRRRVHDLGLGDVVTLTGHVDDATFDQVLAEAAVAVQLRAFTNGESSAAVMDALSAGIPTVVTALGAMSELPADAVVHVRPAITADELADVLVDLLGDARRRSRLRTGAHAYAADHGFAHAADRLLEAIRA